MKTVEELGRGGATDRMLKSTSGAQPLREDLINGLRSLDLVLPHTTRLRKCVGAACGTAPIVFAARPVSTIVPDLMFFFFFLFCRSIRLVRLVSRSPASRKSQTRTMLRAAAALLTLACAVAALPCTSGPTAAAVRAALAALGPRAAAGAPAQGPWPVEHGFVKQVPGERKEKRKRGGGGSEEQ